MYTHIFCSKTWIGMSILKKGSLFCLLFAALFFVSCSFLNNRINKTAELDKTNSISADRTIALNTTANRNPVLYYGEMKVNGNRIYGSKTNAPVQVKGMSFFWSNWSDHFYNARTVDRLVDEFKCEIVRAAYGVDEYGNVFEGSFETQVEIVVEQAIERGIYVIIDWHSHGASDNPEAARVFFSKMAQKYGRYDNVIFELFNEPVYQPWPEIKKYAEDMLSVIRPHSDNLVILGTSNWSQSADRIIGNPVNDSNLAYTLHFYASTHSNDLRIKADRALNAGLALMVTEWGTCSSTGNGHIDYGSAHEWLAWMDERKISWTNWAVNDKIETASIFKKGGMELTESGFFLKDTLTSSARHAEWRTVEMVHPTTLPGIIEAEMYSSGSGIQKERCSEGGEKVRDFTEGDWLIYKVDVQKAGTYKVEYRVAGWVNTGSFKLKNGNTVLDFQEVSVHTAYPGWQTISGIITLSEGEQDLTLTSAAENLDINWIRFSAEIAPANYVLSL